MRRFLLALTLTFFSLGTVAAFAQSMGARDVADQALRDAALNYRFSQAASAGDKPPRDAVIIVPQYYYSHNDHSNFNADAGKFTLDKGHASGGGITLGLTREVTDTLALTFMYQYIRMKYSGGGMVPASLYDGGMNVHEELTNDTHGFFFIADWDLEEAGRVNASFILGLDYYDGDQDNYMNGAYLGSNSMDNFKDQIYSFMLWYENDAHINDNWMLTPYAGWRSVYAHLDSPMGYNNGDGNYTKDDDAYTWVNLITGGLKLKYAEGLWKTQFRAGVNYRLSRADVPGFGIRVLEPSVGHPGYYVNLDRTVFTGGVQVSRFVPDWGLALFAGYDGMFGSSTSAHIGTLGLAIPF